MLPELHYWTSSFAVQGLLESPVAALVQSEPSGLDDTWPAAAASTCETADSVVGLEAVGPRAALVSPVGLVDFRLLFDLVNVDAGETDLADIH